MNLAQNITRVINTSNEINLVVESLLATIFGEATEANEIKEKPATGLESVTAALLDDLEQSLIQLERIAQSLELNPAVEKVAEPHVQGRTDFRSTGSGSVVVSSGMTVQAPKEGTLRFDNDAQNLNPRAG